MSKEEKTNGGFTLPNKKVFIKPNTENPGRIKNPRHIAYFKMEGTYDYLTVPPLRNSKTLVNPLTDEEKDFLEQKLMMEKNDLSIHKKVNNYWRDFFLKLGKDAVSLDLSQPEDYIKYKVALVNKELIAPSKSATKHKRSYKYYIEDESNAIVEQSAKVNLNKSAWSNYIAMEKDKDKLRQFLLVFNESFNMPHKKMSDNIKIEFLQKEVSEIVENRMRDFVDITEDPDYEYRVVIGEGISTGVIERKGIKYYLQGGKDKLGDNLVDTIDFLKSPVNQDTKLLIEQRIKKNK